ncbi:MAG: enoyl-CoA hydratase [Halieaceae bacterium]|jgi:enoyl-CoA hydratase/carnithine racemase|nr:enoyl-CoA hydratase [Halieaceae bacterium]
MNLEQFRDISYQLDDDGIVTLTFNTPQRKNALSLLTFFEIYAAIEQFEQDNSAHAMILTGARDPNSDDPAKEAYSSGGYFNPDAFEGVPEEVIKQIDMSDIAQKRTTLKVLQCEKPIIAAINGLAIGGAFTFTLAAADQIFMSEHAWIQLPFAKLGISVELGSSFMLTRLLGFQKAKEILFYSEKIDAQQALQLQLVNKVLPHEELLSYTRQKTLQLIPPAGAGLAIREMKKLLHEPHIDAIGHALDLENQALGLLFKSSDFAEGIAARVERRPPVFTGS